MQRCHPDQVPSGIPLAVGDTSWGLQRIGNGLVAVCVEIHDKREGYQVQRVHPAARTRVRQDRGLWKDRPTGQAVGPAGNGRRPATEVRGGTTCRRSEPLTEGNRPPCGSGLPSGGPGCQKGGRGRSGWRDGGRQGGCEKVGDPQDVHVGERPRSGDHLGELGAQVTQAPWSWKGLAKRLHSASMKQRAACMGASAPPSALRTASTCQPRPSASLVWSRRLT